MILRQRALAHGRIAYAKPATRSWRRALQTVTTTAEPEAPAVAADQVPGDLSSVSTVEQDVVPHTRQTILSREEQASRFARNYYASVATKKWSETIGSNLTPHYQPHQLINNPPGPSDVTLELLMASQAHLGHATGLWHPGNARYIYGIREGVHVISLDVTASHLRRACKIVQTTTMNGGLVLFVGTRKGQERSVVKAAQLARGCHIYDRWIPGTITNRNQILGQCELRVVDQNDQTVDGFDEDLRDRASLKPDLVVCLNPLENYVLLRECRLHHIPTIGIVDTDCNPTWVTYPIPANDDSRRCTNLIAGVLGRAGELGVQDRFDPDEGRNVILHDANFQPEDGEAENNEGVEHEVEQEDEGMQAMEDDAEAGAVEDGAAMDEMEEGAELNAMGEPDESLEQSEEMTQQREDFLEDVAEGKANADYDEEETGNTYVQAQRVLSEFDRSDEAQAREDGDKQPAEYIAYLDRLVALKRRALNERLSVRDREALEPVEALEQSMRAHVEAQTAADIRTIDAEVERIAALPPDEGEVAQAEQEGLERLADNVQRRTAHYDDEVSFGPVRKTRKGLPPRR